MNRRPLPNSKAALMALRKSQSPSDDPRASSAAISPTANQLVASQHSPPPGGVGDDSSDEWFSENDTGNCKLPGDVEEPAFETAKRLRLSGSPDILVSGDNVASRQLPSSNYSVLDVLRRCGLCISFDTESRLTIDSVAFSRNIEHELASEEDVNRFLDSILDNFNNEQRLQCLLSPTEVCVNGHGTDTHTDSPLHLLLEVPKLQRKIGEALIHKAKEVCDSSDESKTQRLEIIINQFRYLEHVTDGLAFFNAFLELADVAPAWLQRHIFYCLPEILMEQDHDYAAVKLREFMERNPSMMKHILEPLSSMSLSEKLTTDLKTVLLKSVSSCSNHEELLASLQFILDCRSTAESEQVLLALRDNLTSDILSHRRIAEAICYGIQFDRKKLDAVIRIYNGRGSYTIPHGSPLTTMDLFFMFSLLATSRERQAVALMRSLVKTGRLDDSHVAKACQADLSLLFEPLLNLADAWFEAAVPSLQTFAFALYAEVWRGTTSSKREIILAALLNHCTSDNQHVVSMALEALHTLCLENREDYAECDYLFLTLLGMTERYSMENMQAAYKIVGEIGLQGTADWGLRDELRLHITKLLWSPSEKCRHLGVVATLTLCSVSYLFEPTLLTEILRPAWKCASTSSFLTAMFYDQLSVVSGWSAIADDMNWFAAEARKLLDSLSSDVAKRRLTQYEVFEYGKAGKQDTFFDMVALADPEADSSSERNKDSKVLLICPLIRFLGKHSWMLDEYRNDVFQLAEQPILYVSQSVLNSTGLLSEEGRLRMARNIFYNLNFVLEVPVMNILCQLQSEDARRMAVDKLRVVVRMQRDIVACLSGMSSTTVHFCSWQYSVPRSQKLGEEQPSVSIKPTKMKKVPTKKKKKSKKKKKATDEQVSEAEEPNDEDEEGITDGEGDDDNAEMKSSATAPDKVVRISRRLFRELDIVVFNLLKNDLAMADEGSRETGTTLGLECLEYLLLDLDDKLASLQPSHCLAFSPKFKSTESLPNPLFRGLSKDILGRFIIDLMPSLYEHLERCRVHLSAIIEANDGLLDHPKANDAVYSRCVRSVELLLSCLCRICEGLSNFATVKLDDVLDAFYDGGESQPTRRIRVRALYLLQFTDLCKSITAAKQLLRMTRLMVEHIKGDEEEIAELRKAMTDAVLGVLKREWVTGNECLSFRYQVAALLDIVVWCQPRRETLQFLENLALKSIGEALDSNNLESSTYQTLRRETFSTWYHFLLNSLCEHVAEMFDKENATASAQENLFQWALSIKLFRFLTFTVLKKVDKAAVLRSAVRLTPKYMNVFTRRAVHFLDTNFDQLVNEIRPILLAVQQSTRTLQNMCTQLKVNKDKSLTKFVPACRCSLERFVMRVQAMMVANRCPEALEIANLKTRTLKGEEIVESSDDEADEEEGVQGSEDDTETNASANNEEKGEDEESS